MKLLLSIFFRKKKMRCYNACGRPITKELVIEMGISECGCTYSNCEHRKPTDQQRRQQ